MIHRKNKKKKRFPQHSPSFSTQFPILLNDNLRANFNDRTNKSKKKFDREFYFPNLNVVFIFVNENCY
jgi:hypothetical protein